MIIHMSLSQVCKDSQFQQHETATPLYSHNQAYYLPCFFSCHCCPLSTSPHSSLPRFHVFFLSDSLKVLSYTSNFIYLINWITFLHEMVYCDSFFPHLLENSKMSTVLCANRCCQHNFIVTNSQGLQQTTDSIFIQFYVKRNASDPPFQNPNHNFC